MSDAFAVVVTTVGSMAEAETIARRVVEKGIAACAQIAPVRSLYVWNGALEDAAEFRLEMKMRAEDYAALEAEIRALHSYETPEILRLDISAGYGPYLAWIGAAKGV